MGGGSPLGEARQEKSERRRARGANVCDVGGRRCTFAPERARVMEPEGRCGRVHANKASHERTALKAQGALDGGRQEGSFIQSTSYVILCAGTFV